MVFDLKILGFLILLAVGSKASIKKLFFLGPNVEIICPPDATFYQWKKYHHQKMTNIFQDDKRKLNISLRLEDSPTSYECTATTGFDKRTVNITVYIFDRNSKKAQDLCFSNRIDTGSGIKHRVEYPCFLNYQNYTMSRIPKGSSVTLDCEASGMNVSYTWFKLNTPNSHKELLMKHYNLSSLEVNNFDEKSVGQYLCTVLGANSAKLERAFELHISDDPLPGNSQFSVENPETINITSNMNINQKLDCSTKTPIKGKIQAIQWGKKLVTPIHGIDKNQIIHWEGNMYKLLPESYVTDKTELESKIVSSLLLKDVGMESAGEYICVIVTNGGSVKHKTFFVTVPSGSAEEETRHSFFFLYILIPSLIIGICLFIGIYLTVNRQPARKASNFAKSSKLENDTTRLRTAPDYSTVQYQANSPPVSVQYQTNQNYFNPYYPSSDKLIV